MLLVFHFSKAGKKKCRTRGWGGILITRKLELAMRPGWLCDQAGYATRLAMRPGWRNVLAILPAYMYVRWLFHDDGEADGKMIAS
jgi:hypothetical protein